MRIAIDASRAVLGQRPSENFRLFLSALAKIASADDEFVLFTPQPLNMAFPKNFEVVVGGPRYLWTHLYLGKAAEKTRCQALFVYHHILPIKLKIPGVVTIHDTASLIFPESYTKRERLYQDFGNRLALAKAAKIIAVSETTRQNLIKIYGADEKKVVTVYNGFCSSFADNFSHPVVLRHNYGLNRPYLLFVGRQEPRKNVTNLILAFQIFRNQYRVPCDLVLAGSEGPATKEILQLIKIARLSENVKILGRVSRPDLAALYRAAEVFIFPSWDEGFGFPVLEAFSCKTPVVVSNIPVLAEIAQKAALYADPASPHQIAEKIWQAVVDKKLRQRLINAGLKRLKDFSWEKCARETLAQIKKSVK